MSVQFQEDGTLHDPPCGDEQATGHPVVFVPIHRLKKQIQRSLLLAGCDSAV